MAARGGDAGAPGQGSEAVARGTRQATAAAARGDELGKAVEARVFGIEIDTCRHCGGTLRIIASIEQPEVIAGILSHLERTAPQPHPPERPLGARAPPGQARLL